MMMAMAGEAASTDETCTGLPPGLRACSDAKATTIAGAPAWLACTGACAIRQEGADAVVLDAKGQIRQRLAGLTFLPGAGETLCLSVLPFLSEQGRLVLIDAISLTRANDLDLNQIYDSAPSAGTPMRTNLVTLGQLSCDGTRFFAPEQDGAGFVLLNIGDDGVAVPDDSAPVINVSASGRYGLVLTGDDSHLMLRDYAGGPDRPTSAVFERDTAFFDIDEQHLLIRRSDAVLGMVVEIMALDDGKLLGKLAYPPEGGLSFRVVTEKGATGSGQPQLQPMPVPSALP